MAKEEEEIEIKKKLKKIRKDIMSTGDIAKRLREKSEKEEEKKKTN